MDKRFIGTGVALVTPFHPNKTIDFESLKKVIDHCIEGGVNYLVSLGTTGESVVLTNDEKQQVLTKTVEFINGRVPLVAGFGGNDTQQITNDLNSFDLTGIDAILSSSPSYSKPTQEGIYQHYKAIAQSTNLPIILYNVPGRTAQNMSATTTVRLANDFKNIIAIKEASCNMAQCIDIARKAPKDFLLLSGDDIHALPMMSFGCKGVISVIAQATPVTFTTMVNEALAGNFEKSAQAQFALQDIIYQIFEENNPAGIKAALHALGKCQNELRLPLVPATENLYKKLAAEVSKLK